VRAAEGEDFGGGVGQGATEGLWCRRGGQLGIPKTGRRNVKF
jgi:hypothetical protein